MTLKNRFLAASGSALLLGAAALGSVSIQAAHADSPAWVPESTPPTSCATYIDPGIGPVQTPLTCPTPTDPNAQMPPNMTVNSNGAPPSVDVPAPAAVTWYVAPMLLPALYQPSVAYVNQATFLALVAQQLGVSQANLTAAFQQAEAVLATQTQISPTQDMLLSLVAQQLGTSPTSLNLALQQAAMTEVSLLGQTGQLSLAQVSYYQVAIASGQYGLGLGFGIPEFSAPAL